MGVGGEINAGPNLHTDGQGDVEGYHWFVGGSSIGHLGPSNNGTTSASTTNAILSAASTSKAAMKSAMPQWLEDWYDGLSSANQAAFYHQCKHHTGVK